MGAEATAGVAAWSAATGVDDEEIAADADARVVVGLVEVEEVAGRAADASAGAAGTGVSCWRLGPASDDPQTLKRIVDSVW